MGLYDRDYTQEGFRSHYRKVPQMRMSFPSLTPMVKRLLIINVAVFLAGIIIKPLGVFIYDWFQLDATSFGRGLQFWRLITYQFLHDPVQLGHIIFNMANLYFIGPTVERHWGGRKFLYFYLGCGVAGGLFYLFLVSVKFLSAGVMVGASGAILGLIAACAILFPQFVFIIIPIRLAAIVFAGFYLFLVLSKGPNAGGHAAHLAGMAAGAGYVLWPYFKTKYKLNYGTGRRWQRKREQQRNLQNELDRILEKVHKYGIHSLSSREKKILKQATRMQQTQNRL